MRATGLAAATLTVVVWFVLPLASQGPSDRSAVAATDVAPVPADGRDRNPVLISVNAAPIRTPDLAPVLQRYSTLIGGKWVTEFKNPDGTPFGEMRFEWGPRMRTIRGKGLLDKNQVESIVGWDPAVKKAYHVDLSGPETVYFGYYTMEGGELVLDAKTIVGPPSAGRSRLKFLGEDIYQVTNQSIVDGKPQVGYTVTVRRVR